MKSLAALAHPVRLKAFRALVVSCPQGLTPGGMQEGLDIPATTLSFHLKELAPPGLVSQERASRNLVYRAVCTDPQGIAWEQFHTLGTIPVFGEPRQTAGKPAGACCAGDAPRGKAIGIPVAGSAGASCC